MFLKPKHPTQLPRFWGGLGRRFATRSEGGSVVQKHHKGLKAYKKAHVENFSQFTKELRKMKLLNQKSDVVCFEDFLLSFWAFLISERGELKNTRKYFPEKNSRISDLKKKCASQPTSLRFFSFLFFSAAPYTPAPCRCTFQCWLSLLLYGWLLGHSPSISSCNDVLFSSSALTDSLKCQAVRTNVAQEFTNTHWL
jgi:hypothetical protein